MLALAGSLRRDSFNRRLCKSAADGAPENILIDVFDNLASIPLFNEDTEAADKNGPAGAKELGNAISRADGLLIATPEYNQSLPGVLKNAIDWLSRPVAGDALAGKPVAVIGASSGPWGTRLAQKELRHVLHATGALVMPEPMLFVRGADGLFDVDGHLDDAFTREKLIAVLESFATWIKRVNGPVAHDAPAYGGTTRTAT